jgi:hypothetical protein
VLDTGTGRHGEPCGDAAASRATLSSGSPRMRMASGELGECGGEPRVGVNRSGLQAVAAAAAEMEACCGRSGSSRGGDAATACTGDRCQEASHAAGRGEVFSRAEQQEDDEPCAGGGVVHAVMLCGAASASAAGAAVEGDRKWKSGDVERTGAASGGG